MIEVEVKIKISNKENLIYSLLEMGFVKTGYVIEKDTYYNSEFHDFKASDQALRVREVHNKMTSEKSACITFKGKKLDFVSMSRKELETPVENPEIMKEILVNMGLHPVQPVEKERIIFALGNMSACVDQVKDLGSFLELEVMIEEDSGREKALREIEVILGRLGLSMADTTRMSYLSMLESR